MFSFLCARITKSQTIWAAVRKSEKDPLKNFNLQKEILTVFLTVIDNNEVRKKIRHVWRLLKKDFGRWRKKTVWFCNQIHLQRGAWPPITRQKKLRKVDNQWEDREKWKCIKNGAIQYLNPRVTGENSCRWQSSIKWICVMMLGF